MQGATTKNATLKRERFAREYLISLNAVDAYRRAGYKGTGNGAQVNACKLLKHHEVVAIVQAGAKKHVERLDITADRVLQETARLAFAATKGPVTPANKLHALEIIAKILSMFRDAPPPPQWNLDPATLGRMSDEDLQRALTHAEAVQDLLAGKKPTE